MIEKLEAHKSISSDESNSISLKNENSRSYWYMILSLLLHGVSSFFGFFKKDSNYSYKNIVNSSKMMTSNIIHNIYRSATKIANVISYLFRSKDAPIIKLDIIGNDKGKYGELYIKYASKIPKDKEPQLKLLNAEFRKALRNRDTSVKEKVLVLNKITELLKPKEQIDFLYERLLAKKSILKRQMAIVNKELAASRNKINKHLLQKLSTCLEAITEVSKDKKLLQDDFYNIKNSSQNILNLYAEFKDCQRCLSPEWLDEAMTKFKTNKIQELGGEDKLAESRLKIASYEELVEQAILGKREQTEIDAFADDNAIHLHQQILHSFKDSLETERKRLTDKTEHRLSSLTKILTFSPH